ncbi:CubicO group peptidase (beta-lactamase class C family) [Natranaerovirga pectinivora]|uniref:CubicO group peptidase (Beta-lactamase class C family) n=1 Tax=Natranaerovirga pectinivora TaxID=682400 RepID=A0A4R3MNJ2_9FIRM|nr:serine hydrolase domain-containing protein [Natranaerovirga pectinivora]TCT16072.1 CubicO group peptidase (beta-lactamase class C family) [Natranaerovirga pectinivora]
MIAKMKVYFIITLIITTLLGCTQSSNTNTHVVDDASNQILVDFQTKVDDYLNNLEFNGSILLAKNGQIYVHKGYGYSNGTNLQNTEDTIYYIGSITKPITAMAIMQLQEAGKLNVMDTIDKYFPDFIGGEKITIHHLLTHTSGLDRNNYFSIVNENSIMSDDFFNQFYEFTNSLSRNALPGERYSYSNTGYMILGKIIELVSGLSYGDYINEYISKPLDMPDTGFTIYPPERLANPFTFTFKTTYFHPSLYYSTGGIYSTVEDLYEFVRAIKNNTLINEKTTKEMLTPYKDSYSYGWIINNTRVSHNGYIDGYHSYLFYNMKDDTAIIILSNDHKSNMDAIIIKFIRYMADI